MRKGLWPALAVAGLAAPAVFAADLYVTWTCAFAGDLSSGTSVVLFGSVEFGSDRILEVDAVFVAPDAFVGNGTDRQDGTLTIVCDILAPAPYAFDGLTVDLLGHLVPGLLAPNPRIEWTELIFDMSTGEPVLLVGDSGTDTVQPSTRAYRFAPTAAVRVQQTFFLAGVTYRDGEEIKIDPGAVAALPMVEKQVRIVPEPASLSGLLVGVGALLALRRRR